MRVMAAPSKYPDELRERATRMAVDARRDPATRTGALRRIGEQLGINPETLRNWVLQAAGIDEGHGPGTTTDDATRLAELEREARKLRPADAILKRVGLLAPLTPEQDQPSGGRSPALRRRTYEGSEMSRRPPIQVGGYWNRPASGLGRTIDDSTAVIRSSLRHSPLRRVNRSL
jgi:transposase